MMNPPASHTFTFINLTGCDDRDAADKYADELNDAHGFDT